MRFCGIERIPFVEPLNATTIIVHSHVYCPMWIFGNHLITCFEFSFNSFQNVKEIFSQLPDNIFSGTYG